MSSRKAETATLEPEAPHPNGVVYQPKASAPRLLIFNPTSKGYEDYKGLKVYARMKIPMSVYFQTAAPVDVNDPDYWDKVLRRHTEFAARALVSWNVVYPEGHEKAGEPIPATAKGFTEIDLDMAIAIRDAWFYTLNAPENVSDPLASGSPSNDSAASADQSRTN